MTQHIPGSYRRHRARYWPRSTAYYVARRKARRAQTMMASRGQMQSFAQIIDESNLRRVFESLARQAGQAPGLDGLTYSDFGRRELAEARRMLSKQLRDGTYRPWPSRSVAIPKPGQRETRTIRMRIVLDRVVDRALHDAIGPALDRVFLDRSYGFRPGRSTWDMLADLHVGMLLHDRWVLAVTDVRKAFDNVRRANVLDDVRRLITCPQTLALVEVVLRGGDQPRKEVGLDQGSAISPVLLNLHLHYAHDLVMGTSAAAPLWHRYADNLAYLCPSVPVAHQVLTGVAATLQTVGLQLKIAATAVADLREQSVQLIGFQIDARGGTLRYDISQEAYQTLAANLTQAHRTPDPPQIARSTIEGWVAAMGPAYGTVSDDVHQILSLTRAAGFAGTARAAAIKATWRKAHARWLSTLAHAWERQGASGETEARVSVSRDAAGATSIPT